MRLSTIAAAARLANLLVVALLSACRFDPPSTPDLGTSISVEHYAPNRCARGERDCSSDGDCGEGRCVSVLRSSDGADGRDAGHTITVGDRVLWLFGDSFVGDAMLSNTAAWADAHDPRSARDIVDRRSMPVQVIPFRDDEIRFNARHARLPECCAARNDCPSTTPYCHCPSTTDCRSRIALWPGDGVGSAHGDAAFFYERYQVGPAPYDFRPDGVGIATLRAGRLIADRDPGWVFSGVEPNFARGVAVKEHGRQIFYAYATAHRQGCAVDVLCARVESDVLGDRSRYRFWDGDGWSPSLAAARPVARAIAGGLGSVTWNDHIRAYVSVWSDICTGGDRLAVRTAAAPQGPWSDATMIDLHSLGAASDAYYGLAHSSYGSGRDLIVSYFQPRGTALGQLRLLRLTLP